MNVKQRKRTLIHTDSSPTLYGMGEKKERFKINVVNGPAARLCFSYTHTQRNNNEININDSTKKKRKNEKHLMRTEHFTVASFMK